MIHLTVHSPQEKLALEGSKLYQKKQNQSCLKNSSFQCKWHDTEWYWWCLGKPQIAWQSSGWQEHHGREWPVLQGVNTPGSQLGQPDSWHMLDDAHHLTNTPGISDINNMIDQLCVSTLTTCIVEIPIQNLNKQHNIAFK